MNLTKQYKNLVFSEENDIIELTKQMKFDLVLVGNNCMSAKPRGLNKKFNKLFGTKYYELEKDIYHGDINKLGCIEVKFFEYDGYAFLPNNLKDGIVDDEFDTKLVGMGLLYTQYEQVAEEGEILLDYDALRLCLRKINKQYSGLTIGLPIIGSAGAKGDVLTILAIMDEELTDVKPIIVNK